jgi:hypothetical protein
VSLAPRATHLNRANLYRQVGLIHRLRRQTAIMTISSRFRESSLMSPRTAKYVEAMIRQGDSFDYDKWLKRVREEEAQARQAEATGSWGGFVPAQIAAPIKTFDDQHPRLNPAPPLTAKTTLARPLRRSNCQARSLTPKARLRRWLERVCEAWEDFQASRSRDAVYEYLNAVFAIVMHFRVRRRTNRLLRQAFEFAELPCNRRADPFAAIIRCTSDRDTDSKTGSKWSRALRYVARSKEPDMELRTFMKEAGGINACADRHARLMRHR